MSDARCHKQNVTVHLESGLHLRPLSQIAMLANRYQCHVRIRNGKSTVDAKSYLDLMTLNAGQGSLLEIETNGDGAEQALRELVLLFDSNFSESTTS